jgi:hypothetical protein
MLALVGARIYEYDEGGLAYWKSLLEIFSYDL